MATQTFDPAALTLQASKPRSRLAKRLSALGVAVLPLAQDEGPVERYVIGLLASWRRERLQRMA